MSNLLLHKGKFAYGFIDQTGKIHHDFELRLLTIHGEMNSINTLLIEFPELDQLPESERFTIERAATLSEMLTVNGQKLSVDEILNLSADEFTILLAAETNLRKKRSEPTQQELADQEKQH